MKKIKSLREIHIAKDMKDIKGITIPKGTTLFVTNDSAPKHPSLGYKLLVVRVDNGIGSLELCPETCIRDTEIPKAPKKKTITPELPKKVIDYINGNVTFNMFGLLNLGNVRSFTGTKLPDKELKNRIKKHFCSSMVNGQIAFI